MGDRQRYYLVGFTDDDKPIWTGPYEPEEVDRRITAMHLLEAEAACVAVYSVRAMDQTDAIREARQIHGRAKAARHKRDRRGHKVSPPPDA